MPHLNHPSQDDMARPTPAIPRDTEQLPQYDDEQTVTASAVLALVRQLAPGRWPAGAALDQTSQQMVLDVLAALQMVGNATLVKNETYRAMRRDGQEIERLAAGLSRNGLTAFLVEHDGNPVSTALTVIEQARRVALDAFADRGDDEEPPAADLPSRPVDRDRNVELLRD